MNAGKFAPRVCRMGTPRWAGACLLLPLVLTTGCSQFGTVPSLVASHSPVAMRASAARPPEAAFPITLARGVAQENSGSAVTVIPAHPEQLPTPQEVTPKMAAPAPVVAAPSGHLLPIGLDTVLRLVEEQNPQIAQARARLREACAEKDVAAARWLPDLWVGTAFYRHEGGIQNEDGTLTHSSTGALFSGMEIDGRFDVRDIAYQQVNAQRQVLQQKGELSRVSSETLLDASNTYIDLLAARSGEIVSQEIIDKLSDLLERARRLAGTEPAAQSQVARIQAELDAQRATQARLHSQAAGAAAKLIYLLGLDPCAELTPVDHRLVPFDLVDIGPATCLLVDQALTTGPGIQELQGILALIQQSIERSQGAGKYLPVFELRMAEGLFGAGAGDDFAWDNRWDLGLQARWNLTEFVTLRDRRRASQAKIQQAQLAYQDLRGKLAAGVEEARQTIIDGRARIGLSEAQIRDAGEAYDLSYRRLVEAFQTTSYTEALLALDAFGRAKTNYITSIMAYDKAQLRLMVLLGPGACHAPSAPSPAPTSEAAGR